MTCGANLNSSHVLGVEAGWLSFPGLGGTQILAIRVKEVLKLSKYNVCLFFFIIIIIISM